MGFTDDQRATLENVFGSLSLPAVQTAGGGEPTELYGTPIEDLCREEVWKLETPPFDIWQEMVEQAKTGELPDARLTFMTKHYGLFNVAPAQESFMSRIRIPACQVRSYQMRGWRTFAKSTAVAIPTSPRAAPCRCAKLRQPTIPNIFKPSMMSV